MIDNPLDQAITRPIRLPLYYTGLIEKASVENQSGKTDSYTFDRSFCISVPVTIPAQSRTWLFIR